MKIKLVYGAPCSGKSTYVKEHAGEHDFIWDFDKLLMACTNRTIQTTNTPPTASFIIDLRKTIIDAVKSRPSIENLYITCLWITDKLKGEVDGFDTEEIFIEATKDECFQRLDADENRPNKGEWRHMINTWFKEHGPDEEGKTQDAIRPIKFWNFIRNDAGERVLRLDGPISEITWFGDEVTPQIFRNELDAGDGDIIVWINSPGGDVFAATEIFNMLKDYRGNVTVKIDSLAASAASIVAMAGDTVEISPSGQIFLHDPETDMYGNVDDFNAVIQMLSEIKEGIITTYETKTHLPREQISELMTASTWLNAKKAVELGFADRILFAENQSAAETPAQSFSEKDVAESVAAALKSKREAEKKIATIKNPVNAIQRRRRLKLLEEESFICGKTQLTSGQAKEA